MAVGCEEIQNESWFPCDQEQRGGFEGPRSFELLEGKIASIPDENGCHYKPKTEGQIIDKNVEN